MRTLIISTLAIALAGCASPQQLRTQAPLFDQIVAKPPDKVVGCIGDELDSFRKGVTTRPTSTGFTVAAEGSAGLMGQAGLARDTVFVVDIIGIEGRSRIQFFSGLAFSSGNEAVILRIKKCI